MKTFIVVMKDDTYKRIETFSCDPYSDLKEQIRTYIDKVRDIFEVAKIISVKAKFELEGIE